MIMLSQKHVKQTFVFEYTCHEQSTRPRTEIIRHPHAHLLGEFGVGYDGHPDGAEARVRDALVSVFERPFGECDERSFTY
jgi:hypothetical protein